MREHFIKLAYSNPTIREQLLQRLKEAGESSERRDTEESAEPAKSSKKPKGPPPRWDEFLGEKHQKGKVKVTNPNSKTRDKYPQVMFTTALKDKGFMAKTMKEYSEWLKNKPSSKPAKEAPKEDSKKKDAPKAEQPAKETKKHNIEGKHFEKGREENIQGYAKISEDAHLDGVGAVLRDHASVSGKAKISGNAVVSEYAKVDGSAEVSGDSFITDDAWVTGNAQISGSAAISGDSRVAGNAQVSGSSKVRGKALVTGNAALSGFTIVDEGAVVKGDAVIQSSHISGEAEISGDAIIKGAEITGKAKISGTAKITGGTWDGSEGEVTEGTWKSPKEFLTHKKNKEALDAIFSVASKYSTKKPEEKHAFLQEINKMILAAMKLEGLTDEQTVKLKGWKGDVAKMKKKLGPDPTKPEPKAKKPKDPNEKPSKPKVTAAPAQLQSSAERSQYAEKHKEFREFLDKYSAEHKALRAYTGYVYDDINKHLRKGQYASTEIKEYITNLDKAFKLKGATNPERVVVTRGIKNHTSVWKEILAGTLTEGAIIEDKGYMSTSTKSAEIWSWGEVNMLIDVPKGSNCIYVDNPPHPTLTTASGEYELLFPRGTKVKITKIDKANKRIHCQIVTGE